MARVDVLTATDKGGYSGGGTWYSLMSAWESAGQAAFNASEPWTLNCYNDDFGGGVDQGIVDPVLLSGWTAPTATNNVTITVVDGGWHKGDKTKGFVLKSTTAATVFETQIPYVTVSRLRLHGDNASAPCFRLASTECTAFQVLAEKLGTVDNNMVAAGASTNYFISCLAIGGKQGFNNGSQTIAAHFDNCTTIRLTSTPNGFYLNKLSLAKNCAATGVASANALFRFYNPPNVPITNCASDDTTAADESATFPQINISTVAGVDFVDFDNGDYSPAVGGKLDGTGTTGVTYNDITDTPFNDPSEIGAYAVTAAPALFDDTNPFTVTIQAASVSLTLDEPQQAQDLEQVALTQANLVDLGEPQQAQDLGPVGLTQAHLITLNELSQSQSVDAVSLVSAALLAIDAIEQGQSIEQVALSQNYGELAIAALEQSQSMGAATLTQSTQLLISAIEQLQSIPSIPLSTAGVLYTSGISQTQSIGSVQVDQASILAIDEMTQEQIVASTRLGGLVIGYLEGELTIVIALEGDFTIH